MAEMEATYESMLRQYEEFSEVLSRGAVFPLDTVDLNPLVHSWSQFRAFLDDQIADDDVFDLGDVLERTAAAVGLFAAEVSQSFQARIGDISARHQIFEVISEEIRKIYAGHDRPNLSGRIAEFRGDVAISAEIEAFLKGIENDLEIPTVAFDLRVAFGGFSAAIQAFQNEIEAEGRMTEEDNEEEEPLDVAAILALMMSPTPLDVTEGPTLSRSAAPPIADGELPK
jgi:hypothetical protein